ncbi:MAG TPA: aminoacyl-tRNA hydrolase [Deltaproteobacteria bacterium]|nr:aminoacyl-tRNA hydrolase [Candidatus Binatota bacterium]HIL14277.1 aminoacyl-tRNA hydrolase [Deltaproteobacteria bacterium]
MAGQQDLRIRGHLVIPGSLLSVRYSRGGGPGGQNVNKVATRVELLFEIDRAAGLLGEGVVERLRKSCSRRMDRRGRVRIVAAEYRHQYRNQVAARDRLRELLLAALSAPRPRRASSPSRANRERRLRSKHHRGAVKGLRGTVGDDD